MSPEQIALVKHPAFRWTVGMCAIDKDGHRWRILANVGCPGHHAQGEGHAGYTSGWETFADLIGAAPDLTDPATRGCLLDLARTAWNCPSLHAYLEPPYRNGFPDGPGWRVNIYDAKGALALFRASTEGEVLALAILESP